MLNSLHISSIDPITRLHVAMLELVLSSYEAGEAYRMIRILITRLHVAMLELVLSSYEAEEEYRVIRILVFLPGLRPGS